MELLINTHTLLYHITLYLYYPLCFRYVNVEMNFDHIDVAFACAPKNLGIAGLTIVFVRKSLMEKKSKQEITPGILDWKLQIENECLWNTPATFNIYVTGLVCEWMEQEGGVIEMEKRSIEKSKRLYNEIDNSDGFWSTPHSKGDDPKEYFQGERRSRMNVPFGIVDDVEDVMTQEFLKFAGDRNIVGLRTMTPFGVGEYLRASLYNSVSLEDVDVLIECMREFRLNKV